MMDILYQGNAEIASENYIGYRDQMAAKSAYVL